ncbi:hypothetical protein Bhyg_07012, partial [Pseudolycoriella hygida]
KGSTFSTRSKLKQPITTPFKQPPLTAKVVSTWNNVLNKNKELKECKVGNLSSSGEWERSVCLDDREKTLRSALIELKTKIGMALPGNREVKSMIDNILKTFSKIEQRFEIQDSSRKCQLIEIEPSSLVNAKIVEQQRKDEKLKEVLEENLKVRQEKDYTEAQMRVLEAELNSCIKKIEELESALNESVNSERETIANYEQQCKRLQNEIKTLQDSARLANEKPNLYTKSLLCDGKDMDEAKEDYFPPSRIFFDLSEEFQVNF